jgi:hypothetical protein
MIQKKADADAENSYSPPSAHKWVYSLSSAERESQWFSILVHILAETRSFLSSTRHDIDPPFVASSLRRSHRSSFPSAAWSWRERQPLDPVAAVGSGKGSDTNKRNWTGAVPLGARPWRRICRRLVQGEMVLIFPLSLLAAYFG